MTGDLATGNVLCRQGGGGFGSEARNGAPHGDVVDEDPASDGPGNARHGKVVGEVEAETSVIPQPDPEAEDGGGEGGADVGNGEGDDVGLG